MIDARQHYIGKYICYDFEQITVADTAIGLTTSKLTTNPRPKKVIITCETAQFRYRIDGTDPSATVGHLVNPLDSLVLEGYSQLNNFKAIRKGSSSATIFVSYLY